MEHRGTEETFRLINNKLYLYHNRLSINDMTNNGRQPMIKNNIIVVLNGKITNYNKLYDIVKKDLNTYNFKSKSHSEILISLYMLYGTAFIAKLNGGFSFVLFDATKNIFIASRDHIGITSLYYSTDNKNNEDIIVSSEIKPLLNLSKNIKIFEPGHTYINTQPDNHNNLFFKHYNIQSDNNIYELDYNKINELMLESVLEQFQILNKNQTVGVLLTGTLESNILLSIIMKLKKDNLIDNNIKTFTIGLDNSFSVDVADRISKYLECEHYSYTYDIDDIDDIIEDVIYYLESYNINIIRDSIPLYLLSMQIQEEFEIKTLMSADILDKLFIDNLNNKNERASEVLQNGHLKYNVSTESGRLLASHELSKIPISNKLEVMLPFSNKNLIEYLIKLDSKYKKIYTDDPEKNIDKYILRKTFYGYLPDDILWTIDDVNEKNSLINGLTNMSNEKFSDEEFKKRIYYIL